MEEARAKKGGLCFISFLFAGGLSCCNACHGLLMDQCIFVAVELGARQG
jgi:hypothetical protein